MRFLPASRYEIYRVIREEKGGREVISRRKVDTPAAFGVFLEAFFMFFIAVVAAAKRVFVFHALEFSFVESKRRPGHYVLRLKPHVRIGRFFEAHPEFMSDTTDFSEEKLYDRAAEIYNELIDTVTRRDTIVEETTTTNQLPKPQVRRNFTPTLQGDK